MKPFKTLDQQLDILLTRGLEIPEMDKAREYLLQFSYYNVINVYSKFFLDANNPTQYIEHSSFSEIRAVHIFDSELKSIFFKYLIDANFIIKLAT